MASVSSSPKIKPGKKLPPPGSVGGVSLTPFGTPRMPTSAPSPPSSKAVPGSIGSVKIPGSIGSAKMPPKPIKSYPKPLPRRYDTDALNAKRALPSYEGGIVSPTAGISVSPGTSASAVSGAAAKTSSGTSAAVKTFLKNKAASASGSSVIKKFSSRKSIAISGLAVAGLATSIATSKNKLHDRERDR